MPSFTSAAVVAVVALVAPLAIRLAGIRLPEAVLEIGLGVIIGPQVLSWADVDQPVRVLSIIGLAFLLLLSGLEIDVDRLRGRVLRLTSVAFAVSFVLAVAAGFLLGAVGLVRSPLLIAVILSATSVGIIVPVLKDAGATETPFGQVIVAGASIAEVLPIILLSIFFSERSSGIVSQLVLLVTFLGFVTVVGLAIAGFERSSRISRALLALQDTTAEIRVRAAMALLMVYAAVATAFGLEAIFGAFLAGATIKLLDRDREMTHSLLPLKLQAVGFGAFVPFFFVSTGMMLDVRSLGDPSTLVRVAIFLIAILLVRGIPAALYRPLAQSRRQVAAAGLLQATSLSIPVVAGAVGVSLHLIRPDNYVALVAAGVLSVILFPLLAQPAVAAPPDKEHSHGTG